MELKTYFKQNPKVALGFSGGVDSSYLLYAGLHYGANIKPYFIKTAFQPEFEFEDARKMADALGADLTIIQYDVLKEPRVTENSDIRCYFCKTALFSTLKKRALADGYTVLLDGTNASDDVDDRPGMRALGELSVHSPLRICGLTKQDVRRLSKEAGLFTWNKPAYACLATRVPTDEEITEEKLIKVEMSEAWLFANGFTDFRVRLMQDAARLEIRADQMPALLEKRETVLQALSTYFDYVTLDLKAR